MRQGPATNRRRIIEMRHLNQSVTSMASRCGYPVACNGPLKNKADKLFTSAEA
jgi:hypothetical protein